MVSLIVNGTCREIDAPWDEPLAYVLRNRLGLAGTKIACGLEQCGACLVTVDGECRYACTLPVGECADRAVTTVEGLRGDGLHPAQQALLEFNAAQCGYCLSGILVRAAALFDAEPAPSPAQIREALAPQLCRCGAQPRVLRALEQLARDAFDGKKSP
jgi:aerobic-type carbon monoxide dehydrogenase small subunit (CoxS/CutS family)